MRMKSLLLASVFCFQVAMPSFAEEVSHERIKALVAEALRENPELILEALQGPRRAAGGSTGSRCNRSIGQ